MKLPSSSNGRNTSPSCIVVTSLCNSGTSPRAPMLMRLVYEQLAVVNASWRASFVGSHRSSASSNASQSPVAIFAPAFRETAALPLCCVSTVMRSP
jgi:hypothetical protein